MVKGFFTQAAVILTEGGMATDAVDEALGSFDVLKRSPAEGPQNWISGYPSWTLDLRREVNGLIVVDLVNAPWPDALGDPKGDPSLFAAWSMGFMGPGAWPGGLGRAMQQAGVFRRNATAELAARHKGFIRIKSSYVLGASKETPIRPKDYDPLVELEKITSVARALLGTRGALCYFNPAGETLYTAEEFDQSVDLCRGSGIPNLLIWTGNRLVRLDDAPPWVITDVVGMGQLDALDHEACFRSERHQPGDTMVFLRNMSLYTMKNGPVINQGHTTDGPGGVWRAHDVNEGILPGPRNVLRWVPEDGPRPPKQLFVNKEVATPHGKGFMSRMRSIFGK